MRIRRILLLTLWILSLVAISFYGGAISYGFFFCMTLLPVISLLYLICVYVRFRIYQEIESRNIVCREPMPYYFVLQNGEQFAFAGISAKLFSGLSYVEEMPDDVEYELLPEDRYTFRTRLVCRYRGEYEVGVKEIIVTDFFRIFRLHYKLPGTIKALVYPRIIKREELKSIQDISPYLCRENQRLQTDMDTTLRDYVAGDALKYVHWKATAKEQKLKIRNRIGEEQQGIHIFYDTKRYYKNQEEYLPLENQILELVLALGYFFCNKSVAFSVWCGQRSLGNGMKHSQMEGMSSFDLFYQEMSQVVFDQQENSKELFGQLVLQRVMSESRAVIAILHELDDCFLRMAEQLVAEGELVVLYVVTDENIDRYVRQSSSRLRIIAVPTEVELEEWL